MPVCEMDVCVGGRYRWRWRSDKDASEFGFAGTFREVNPPSRLDALLRARIRRPEWSRADPAGQRKRDDDEANHTASLGWQRYARQEGSVLGVRSGRALFRKHHVELGHRCACYRAKRLSDYAPRR